MLSKIKNNKLLILGLLAIICISTIGGLVFIIINNIKDEPILKDKTSEIIFLQNSDTIPSNNDVILKSAVLNDDILALKITYGGCEEPILKLYVSPNVTSSEPPIITATIVRDFTGDSCERLNESYVNFSIDSIIDKFNLFGNTFNLSIVDSQNNNFILSSKDTESSKCASEMALFDKYMEDSKLPIIGNEDSLCYSTNVGTDFSKIPTKLVIAKLVNIEEDFKYTFIFQGQSSIGKISIPMTETEKNSYEIGHYYKIDMMNICRHMMMMADSMSPSKIADTFINPEKTSCDNEISLIFKYGVGSKNILNTYEGTFTKDMIVDPSITTEMILTSTDLQNIYNKAKELDLFGLKNTKKQSNENMMTTPCSSYYLKLSSSDINEEISWDNCTGELRDEFTEFSDFIIDIIQNKNEYKALPEPQGGYL